MNEVLTAKEIQTRFADEWVLVENPITDEGLAVQGGIVRWHSKERDEVYDKALEIPPPRSIAFMFTGSLPNDAVIVL